MLPIEFRVYLTTVLSGYVIFVTWLLRLYSYRVVYVTLSIVHCCFVILPLVSYQYRVWPDESVTVVSLPLPFITSVSSYYGYYTEGGALEVGRSSTKAVVYSSVLILLFNLILTQLLLA